MNYKAFFSAATIIPNLNATSKYEVITALVDVLQKKNKISDREKILSEVIRRESVSSTGIENGLAIPHAVIKEIDKIVTSIARIPKGIDFVSQDRKPTYFAVLICYPPSQDPVYLNLLSGISRVFLKKENLDTLLKQKNSKDIYKTLINLLENSDEIINVSKKDHDKDIKISEVPNIPDAPQDIHLIIRLQWCEYELKSSPRKKKEILEKIKNLRSLISPAILKFYDKLKVQKFPAVVPIEGNICKGCNTSVPNEFLSHLIQNRDKINYCPNCKRFVYLP
ncbi:MAG: PTS sugar transporter subunit IIA [Candidatus Hydrogenedentes bacterium]|nr:PTS sugar transporter subunit IIA [Candidatus Hydrogenedentota bacterium]